MARYKRMAGHAARLANERKKGNQIAMLEGDIGNVMDKAQAAGDNWKTWGAGAGGFLGGMALKKAGMYGLGLLGTAATGGALGPILLNPAFQMAASTGLGMLPGVLATKAGEEAAGAQTQALWDEQMGGLTSAGNQISGYVPSDLTDFAKEQTQASMANMGAKVGGIASLANVATGVGDGLGAATSTGTAEAAGATFLENNPDLASILTPEQAGIISKMNPDYQAGVIKQISKGGYTPEQISQVTSSYNAPIGEKLGGWVKSWWDK